MFRDSFHINTHATRYCNNKYFNGKKIISKHQAIEIASAHAEKTVFKYTDPKISRRAVVGKCLVDYSEILKHPRKFRGIPWEITFEKYFTPNPGFTSFEGRIYWEISFLFTPEKGKYILHGESYLLIDAISGEVVFTLKGDRS